MNFAAPVPQAPPLQGPRIGVMAVGSVVTLVTATVLGVPIQHGWALAAAMVGSELSGGVVDPITLA